MKSKTARPVGHWAKGELNPCLGGGGSFSSQYSFSLKRHWVKGSYRNQTHVGGRGEGGSFSKPVLFRLERVLLYMNCDTIAHGHTCVAWQPSEVKNWPHLGIRIKPNGREGEGWTSFSLQGIPNRTAHELWRIMHGSLCNLLIMYKWNHAHSAPILSLPMHAVSLHNEVIVTSPLVLDSQHILYIDTT